MTVPAYFHYFGAFSAIFLTFHLLVRSLCLCWIQYRVQNGCLDSAPEFSLQVAGIYCANRVDMICPQLLVPCIPKRI